MDQGDKTRTKRELGHPCPACLLEVPSLLVLHYAASLYDIV